MYKSLCVKGLKEKHFAFSLVFRSLYIILLILDLSWDLEENLNRRLIFILHNLGETSVIQWMSFKEGNFNSHCAGYGQDTIFVKDR